jgi:NADH:ubiquinone oxidoreductase subunit D
MPETTFLDTTELVLNMGPQHPSTHGVLRVILKLDGEKVIGTECVIGLLVICTGASKRLARTALISSLRHTWIAWTM